MDQARIRGFVNTLNMEAEKLGLTDIQIAQVPADKMEISEVAQEANAGDPAEVYITISKKDELARYPPQMPLVAYALRENDPSGSAGLKVRNCLLGIKLARDIADQKITRVVQF